MRQGYQVLFMVLSVVGVAGLMLAWQRAKSLAASATQQLQLMSGILLVYAVFAIVIVFAVPGNPDPVPVPIDLLELFRALTMVGQFLQWALLAVGVGLALVWFKRKEEAERSINDVAVNVPGED